MIPSILLFERTNFTDFTINSISDPNPDRSGSIRSVPIWISNVANLSEQFPLQYQNLWLSRLLIFWNNFHNPFRPKFQQKGRAIEALSSFRWLTKHLPSCSMTKIIRIYIIIICMLVMSTKFSIEIILNFCDSVFKIVLKCKSARTCAVFSTEKLLFTLQRNQINFRQTNES